MTNVSQVNLADEEWVKKVSDIVLKREIEEQYMRTLIGNLNLMHAVYLIHLGPMGLN